MPPSAPTRSRMPTPQLGLPTPRVQSGSSRHTYTHVGTLHQRKAAIVNETAAAPNALAVTRDALSVTHHPVCRFVFCYTRRRTVWRRKYWTDRPALGGHFVGAAAHDVRAPPRVCAAADVLYESYINLAPRPDSTPPPWGADQTRSAEWKLHLPISFASTRRASATPSHLAAGR